MFVQLRRVVYLLVVLQCCLYVVSAADAQEFEQARNRLQAVVNEVVSRSAVREKWLEERRSALEACETDYKEAEAVVNEIKILMAAIKEKVKGETIPDAPSRLQEEVVELVSRAIEIIPRAEKASTNCDASYKKALNTERLLKLIPEGMEEDLQELKKALTTFGSVSASEENKDIKEKELRFAYATYYKLFNISQDFTSLDAKLLGCNIFAKMNGKEADDAKNKLTAMIGNHGETVKQLQQRKEQAKKAYRERQEAAQRRRNMERRKWLRWG
ncbi:uncharacterized protein TM35_000102660 [Trypanosoma theileri]|uniref:Uncharacterized protein n=1 Tax=Trypanosoma theileri TaxID=67003 RepID=A0A1X0NZM3_9TRYP|nr:uncharacterized protein TM35_000102660 [Trypanosoma theileri]ORC89998.1 hypothetical protein TM35_000102660 [Trypanosoma theileri]